MPMSKNIDVFTDADLVKMICGQAYDRERALHYIYVQSGWTKEAMRGLQKQGVSVSDAKNAIQEALIVLDKHIREGDFDKQKSVQQYFWGICKGRVFSNNRSQWRISHVEETPDDIVKHTPETETISNDTKTILRQLIGQLSERCQERLRLYLLSFSHKEVRDIMNLPSEEMARKLAHDCRSKLGKLIDKNPTLKNNLKSDLKN